MLIKSFSLTNRRKGGEPYLVISSISPIKSPDGEITHFLAVQEDVTDRRMVEAQLQQSATERTCRRHPQLAAPIAESLDVRQDGGELFVRSTVDPLHHLRLQLDGPHDTKDDIRPRTSVTAGVLVGLR